jgi:hypothetical protein
VLNHLPASNVAVLTGHTFFPRLISGPFHHGLVIVFSVAMAILVIAAIASALRGGRYVHDDQAAVPAEVQAGASAEVQAAASAEIVAAAENDAAAEAGAEGSEDAARR